jgi:hypothetical protein
MTDPEPLIASPVNLIVDFSTNGRALQVELLDDSPEVPMTDATKSNLGPSFRLLNVLL